jgi:hypothetical protein
MESQTCRHFNAEGGKLLGDVFGCQILLIASFRYLMQKAPCSCNNGEDIRARTDMVNGAVV